MREIFSRLLGRRPESDKEKVVAPEKGFERAEKKLMARITLMRHMEYEKFQLDYPLKEGEAAKARVIGEELASKGIIRMGGHSSELRAKETAHAVGEGMQGVSGKKVKWAQIPELDSGTSSHLYEKLARLVSHMAKKKEGDVPHFALVTHESDMQQLLDDVFPERRNTEGSYVKNIPYGGRINVELYSPDQDGLVSLHVDCQNPKMERTVRFDPSQKKLLVPEQ